MPYAAVWHGHHKGLISFLESVEDRIEDIKQHKPKHEHELRLCLLKSVKGKLPAAVLEAWAAYEKTSAALENKWDVPEKAWAVLEEAGAAYHRAIADNLSAIEALHAKECPNCPYADGTIFSKGE